MTNEQLKRVKSLLQTLAVLYPEEKYFKRRIFPPTDVIVRFASGGFLTFKDVREAEALLKELSSEEITPCEPSS